MKPIKIEEKKILLQDVTLPQANFKTDYLIIRT